MIFTDDVPLYCNKRCRVESGEECFLFVFFLLSLKVLLNPHGNKELSVRAEEESKRIKEPELPLSKPLIPVGFLSLRHCAEVQIIFSPSALAARWRKKPLSLFTKSVVGLESCFSPQPLRWLWEAQETLFVLGTVF